jgi:hypothetical protein
MAKRLQGKVPPANYLASMMPFPPQPGMSRFSSHEGGMGWTARILLAILALLILGGIGLGVYAGTIKPPHQAYTVVIPNSRFPG